MDTLKKNRILIATYPFGKSNREPLDILEANGCELIFNPHARRLKAGEVEELIQDVDAVIAGTEPYMINALKSANIKVISRVGIGLDNVPLKELKELGIMVTYTPDAPSQGVAELTLANIISLVRFVQLSDHSVRQLAWNRYIGYLLKEIKIGVIGIGRIGKILVKLLQPFNTNILACDINPDLEFGRHYNLEWHEKESILREADLITVHIPYNQRNHHFIDRKAIASMKSSSFLVNTSRGNIVDEEALYDALKQKHIEGAALDVFAKEPYDGPLAGLENIILTAHMGASAKESRYLMELGAAEDCIRVLKGEKPKHDAWEENKADYE
ncbi:MAG: phosphoglycerate dehydrogenase [Firmicutes bacterium]|nr:phosphoglycerate dehydrogenase [Bacillota bacterium]